MSKLTHHWNPRLSRSTYAVEAECREKDITGILHDRNFNGVTCTACLLALRQRVLAQADDLIAPINKRIEELTKEEA